MLKRVRGYLKAIDAAEAPAESRQLEAQGYVLIRGVFSAGEVAALAEDINRVFDEYPADGRSSVRPADEDNMFRYEMFNRSEVCLNAIAHQKILAVIEPLLGQDCHVIANTAWRNDANHQGTHGGQAWHIDAGPHVPLPAGVSWPKDIPHPVFAIGAHLYLKDCSADDGPTGVIPGSHLSGQFPPVDRYLDDDLEYEGKGVEPLIAAAGDVGLFVSDVWHRRMPAGDNDSGRFFLQAHYARRDIAQRIKPTAEVNHLDGSTLEIEDARHRTLVGLHHSMFYDG